MCRVKGMRGVYSKLEKRQNIPKEGELDDGKCPSPTLVPCHLGQD